MSGLLTKVWFDLWDDKTRTLQVVLVIALGAIGIGLVIGGRNLIAESVLTGWQSAEPPNIKLNVEPPLTAAQIERLGRIEGVAEVEGLYNAPIEWRFVGDETWQTGVLNGRDDYTEQKMALDGLLAGEWPGRNTLGIGKISVGPGKVAMGDTVEIRFGDTVRQMPVVGQVDPVGPTPVFQETFYANGRTFTRITGIETYNLIQTRGPLDQPFSFAAAEATDLRIQAYFEDINVSSFGLGFPAPVRITSPNETPAEDVLNALFLLLGLLGAIVIILGIFLVYNSISAIVSQQVDQIGVMKAIGADSRQVVSSYLLLVLAYGFLAALVAVPIGAFAALGIQLFFAQFLNLEIFEAAVDPMAIWVQLGICFIAPLLAAIIPLRSGMKITVREAISTYGLSGAIGLVDRLVAKAKAVPYILLLTIGNTFRNRRRVLVIEFALVVAGTIFMMVMGLNDATNYTFGNKLAEVQNYQVTFNTEQPERAELLEAVALEVDGVTSVESWLLQSATIRPVSQVESDVEDARVTVYGQSAATTFYRPELLAGRWLLPTDENQVVVSQRIAEEQGWTIGDVVTLENGNGRILNTEIVGIVFDPATNSSVHLPLAILQREWRNFGLANKINIQTTNVDAAFQLAVAEAATQAFEESGIGLAPANANTIAEITDSASDGFDIILNLLAVMAVVIALVGGVGLSGILSLSVLERRREIGVMRAIGASNWQVIRLFVGEGVLLGLLSWLIAFPLSIPFAYLFATQALSFALNQQLVYQFTPAGAILWLVIISVLAMIASALPARGASKISVRESLAYS